MAKKKKAETNSTQEPLTREQLSSYKPNVRPFDSMSIVTDPTLNSLFELAKTTNTYIVQPSREIKNNVVPKLDGK